MDLEQALDGHPVTYNQAARELRDHGHEARQSERAGYFEGLMESVDREGTVHANWEPVALNSKAILVWLGY